MKAHATAPDTEKPAAPAHELHDRGHGRHARKPTDVPKIGWLDILLRTQRQIAANNLSIVAAGVAFYAFVAVVPALAALISIYGLVSNPAQVAQQIETLAQVLPGEVLPLLREQMARITANNQAAGISALISFAVALYGSANATKALMRGLNIAYDEEERRNMFKLFGLAFLLTIGGIVGVLIAISLVAFLPVVLRHLHITSGAETLISFARWPILLGFAMFGLAVMYRYGPCREDARWRWVSWGAAVATVLWLIASGAFSLYVSEFASYDKTYGPLGSVVIFLMWLFISAFVVLLGAELNAEMERQTLQDTTTGPEKPLGQRGAKAADTVGPTRESLRPAKKK